MDTSPTRLNHDRTVVADILDVVLAAGLTALTWVQASVPSRILLGRPPGPEPGRIAVFHHVTAGPFTFLLIALCLLPLAVRRRFPVTVLGISSIAYVVYQFTRNPPAFLIFGVLIALYTVAATTDRRRLAVWGGAFGALVLLASLPDFGESLFFGEFVRTSAMLLAAGFLGDATRSRRAYVREVERRAAEAERTREEEALRRVDEERLRIARELHDITAHSLSIVAVQSAAAAHVIDTDPAEAKRSLAAIRETSRSALNELRAMLGALRGAGDETAPLTPTPGLSRLGELVGPLTDAGFVVDVDEEGDLAAIPPFVDASAYRIVQEALTNVLRHAGRTHVSVHVAYDGHAVAIEVCDDGKGTAGSAGGHGIAGMRERAAALGGTFDAGPRPEGGWFVRAGLPAAGRMQ